MMDISVEDDEEVEEEVAEAADGEVTSNYPDMDVDQSMIELVASQGKVTEHRAKIALQNEKGDVIAALMVSALSATSGLSNWRVLAWATTCRCFSSRTPSSFLTLSTR